MKWHDAIGLAKCVGLTMVAALAFEAWLRTPVLDVVGIREWRAVALAGGLAMGSVGAFITGARRAPSVSVPIGLVLASAWAEFRLSDVRIDIVDSVTAGIVNEGHDMVGPSIACTVGAFVTHLVVHRKAGLGGDSDG